MNTTPTIQILLIEDNRSEAELTLRALRKHQLASQLLHVRDGAEALDYLLARNGFAERPSTEQPRVIFLDLRLPKVSGLEVLRVIKQDPRTRLIPVVVVTASTADPDIQQAYALGANSYIVKPVGFTHFSETIGALGHYWLSINRTSEPPTEGKPA